MVFLLTTWSLKHKASLPCPIIFFTMRTSSLLRIDHPDGILGEPFTSILITPHSNLGSRPELPALHGEAAIVTLQDAIKFMHPAIIAMNEVSVVGEAFVEWACWMRVQTRQAYQSTVVLSVDDLTQSLVFFMENHVAESWTCPWFALDKASGAVTTTTGLWSMADLVCVLFSEDIEQKVRAILMAYLVPGDKTIPSFNGVRAAFPLARDGRIANLWHFDWFAHCNPLVSFSRL
ncbi:hypothetical protein BCR44DRAFT_1182263 [Catenaria anguillulae PL171]|uniref:Uncharacterized protein n=1 Tax=Catenaria anguillulae PL171 TaxID=765915 RepID=A0A1Y2HJC9_9FUNG|nr:hypothetical protein BCR44DRAFT_1182263 [Catenaria anguillulae PL171]